MEVIVPALADHGSLQVANPSPTVKFWALVYIAASMSAAAALPSVMFLKPVVLMTVALT